MTNALSYLSKMLKVLTLLRANAVSDAQVWTALFVSVIVGNADVLFDPQYFCST
jgi:hypothetical protein